MKRFGRTCLEIFVLLIAAGVVGLVTNSISADGIRLGRDYFPRMSPPPQPPPSGNHEADRDDGPPVDDPRRTIDGVQAIGFDEVVEYADLLLESDGFIMILDARTDDAYRSGHIPGALQVDHYRQDKYLPDILPMLREAGVIIVYCNGGTCEDSVLLASSLIHEHALPYEKVYVYEGGVQEWQQRGQPVTKGVDP